jgi:hypothetical protein
MFKDGSNAEVKLASIATTYVTGFESTPASIDYTQGSGLESCTTALARQLDINVLLDDVAVVLTLGKDTGSCANFDTSTYNATSKTATIKHLVGSTTGIDYKRLLATGFTYDAAKPTYLLNSTLATDVSTGQGGGTYFKDSLSSSNSTAQDLYITATSVGKDGFTKDQVYPVAYGVVDVSKNDVNLNVSGVTLGSDKTNFKAFAHNLNKVTKDGTYSLYVPYKTKDNFIGVCSGATDLAGVTNKCSGVFYLKDKQSKTSKDTKSIPAGKTVAANITTVNGMQFWKIDGLTSSGAFSATLASDPDTGISTQAISPSLAIAGVIATITFLVGARYASGRR